MARWIVETAGTEQAGVVPLKRVVPVVGPVLTLEHQRALSLVLRPVEPYDFTAEEQLVLFVACVSQSVVDGR